MKTRVINIIGVDGSGKTTLVNLLQKKLNSEGYDVEVLWLRFNHLFTKPLLVLCKLIGLTRYVRTGNVTVGYHDFYRVKFIAVLFVMLQYLDALRVRIFVITPILVSKKKKILIIDRYVFDILVDIMVDTHFFNLYQTRAALFFKALVPKKSIVVLLQRNLNQLLEARTENQFDNNFLKRVELYSLIAKEGHVISIPNDDDLDKLLSEVESVLNAKY